VKLIASHSIAARLFKRAAPKSFGLDHSFAALNAAAEAILNSQELLTPDEFIRLIDSFGSIACYETIPPEQLEVCTDASLSFNGQFVPLTNYGA
jgi:hypothetical protein